MLHTSLLLCGTKGSRAQHLLNADPHAVFQLLVER